MLCCAISHKAKLKLNPYDRVGNWLRQRHEEREEGKGCEILVLVLRGDVHGVVLVSVEIVL